MLLGAFFQAGVPVSWLEQELKKLPIAEEFKLQVEKSQRGGIQAVYMNVILTQSGKQQAEIPMPEHSPEKKEKCHEHPKHHKHRTMSAICKLLEKSALSPTVKQTALRIFETLAEAEGKVHGCSVDAVSFHEVGAVDSLVDIIGIALCLDYLKIEKVFASTLNVGSGFVYCAHGWMPVPAPATAELLKGWHCVQIGAEKELTTPTGAAVVKTLAEYSESLPQGFVAERIAYGAGTWQLDIPNVVRLYVGKYQGKSSNCQYILETNIDDMNPQIYGYLYDKLLKAGALDVWTTAIYMKKNRPAQQLSVLTDAARREICADIIFSETTTIGLRILPVDARWETSRHMAKVETKYGMVNCKVSAWRGRLVQVSAEYEDCRRLAEKFDVPLKFVQQEALKIFNDRIGN